MVRLSAPLMILALSSGCVLDRTGQSASGSMEKELSAHAGQLHELESRSASNERRAEELEELVRYRGQQDAQQFENFEQVRTELYRLRGAVEVLEHDGDTNAEQSEALRADLDFRLSWLELRVEAIEGNLGLTPPDPPMPELEGGDGEGAEAGEGEAGDVGVDGEDGSADGGFDGGAGVEEGGEVEEASPQGPEELFKLGMQHLEGGRPRVARAVFERVLEEHPDYEERIAVRYRLAQTWLTEGEYQQAILSYEEVVGAGDPAWAAWAMVRQGDCFSKLGKSAEAQLFWEDVVSRYPDTPAAKEARSRLGQ